MHLVICRCLGIFCLSDSIGQISITSADIPFSQDFNTLATSGSSSTLPAGWALLETGSGTNIFYTASEGLATAGDTYSYGTSSQTERALGEITTPTFTSHFGASFTNNIGSTFTSILISYTGEQWRLGTPGMNDTLHFQYSTNATSLSTGTWTDVNNLDFHAPVTAGNIGVLNGNTMENRTNKGFLITGLSIANGSTFWIRWMGDDASNADHGLAIDDFSIVANPVTTHYTFTYNAGNQSLLMTDAAGNGDLFQITEAGSSMRFFAQGRTYKLNGGAIMALPVEFSIATLAVVDFNAAGGNDVIQVGAFASLLPSINLNGGIGDDAILFNGDMTMGSNNYLHADLQNDDPSPGVDQITLALGANLTTSGTGTILMRVSKNVIANPSSGLTTSNGNLIVEANQQVTPTTGTFTGIELNSATFQITGTGTMTLKGKGGTAGASQYGIYVWNNSDILAGTSGTATIQGNGGASIGSQNVGVYVSGIMSSITSAGSAISVTGTGGSFSGGTLCHGVYVTGGGIISSGGSGALNITGNAAPSGGSDSQGVRIEGPSITTSGGNITINGQGNGAVGINIHGVYMLSTGSVSAGGSGTVQVTGTGGAGPTSHGVFLTGFNVMITSSGGNVNVTGIGAATGNTMSSSGVRVEQAAKITAGPGGSVMVNGTGAMSISGNQNGVFVTGTSSQITSSGGPVSVIGQGGGTSNSSFNFGIAVTSGGVITAQGSGTVTVAGTGGLPAGGSDNRGVYIDGGTSMITSSGGNVNVTGTAGNSIGQNQMGISVSGAGQITAGSGGSVTVTGNGGTGSTASENHGVYVTGSNSAITSVSGNVQVNGTGGGASNATVNVGVYVTSSGTINAGGTGSVTVNGTGGNTGGANNFGVEVIGTNSSITSSGGNVIVTGTGGGNNFSLGNYGVYVASSGKIGATGMGTTSVTGDGGPAKGNMNYGVMVTGALATITSSGGAVSVEGNGGGLDNSNSNYGVYVVSGGRILSGSNGTVMVEGNGGLTTGSNNYGIRIEGASSVITSGGNGAVTVTGQGGGISPSQVNAGVYVLSSGSITGGTGSTVTVAGTGGNSTGGWNYGVHVEGSTSFITSTNGNVSVTGTGGGSMFAAFNYGVYILGGSIRAGSGGQTQVTGFGGLAQGNSNYGVAVVNLGSNISSISGSVTVNGTGGGSSASANNYGVFVTGGYIVSNGAGTLTVNGTGGFGSGNSNHGVHLELSGYITCNGATATITGIGGGTGASGSNHGVSLEGTSYITSAVAGNLIVNGTGKNTTGNSNMGVNVASGPANGIYTTSANILVTGQGGGTTFSVQNYGVNVAFSQIKAGGTGTVQVSGFGGATQASDNYGVRVSGGGTITSNNGNVDVEGTGGCTSGAPGMNQHGVTVLTNGVISAGGTGNVTVIGTGAVSGGNTSAGVQVNGLNAVITSSGGTVMVTGTGGGFAFSSNFNHGVNVVAAGKITAGSAGNVIVTGYGSPYASGGNYGVNVENPNSTITSSGGQVTINGFGGGLSSSNSNSNCHGIRVADSGAITAGGMGTVMLNGVGSPFNGNSNYGVFVTGAGSKVTSTGGNVALHATAVNQSSNLSIAIHSSGSVTTSTNGGDILLQGNSISFIAGAVKTNAMDTVTVVQKDNDVPVGLGISGDPPAGPLQLTDTELDSISTGTLLIGNTSSGVITIASDVSRTAATQMRLTTATNIVFSGGSLHTGGGTLFLDSGSSPYSINPDQADTDVFSSTLTLQGPLLIAINGIVADVSYTQLKIEGGINLNSVPLTFTGTYLPLAGDIFTIVLNDSNDPVVGIFNGLMEGDTLFGFLDPSAKAVISYTGGDGNDVTIHVVIVCDLPDIPSLSAVPDTVCAGTQVTLSVVSGDLGDAVTWNWYSASCNGTLIGTGSSILVNPTLTTTYFARGGGGCVTSGPCANITVTVNPDPDPSIQHTFASPCFFTDQVFQPVAPLIPGAAYQWSFGANASPATATGYGPHTVQYAVNGSKTVKLVIYPNAPGAQCPDSAMLSFTITSCPGQIFGHVKSVSGTPIANVTLKLYADANTDGVADDGIAIKTSFTNVSGGYAMANVTPGHYVLLQTQPAGWVSFDDGDNVDTGDAVPNIDSLDNLIPVSLIILESDSLNDFIEIGAPGTISGSVFNDFDGDQVPEPGEGLPGVNVRLFADTNTNGVADSGIPVASQNTNSSGAYAFTNVAVGHYVLVETNLTAYLSVKDIDTSPDGDAVPNTNMTNDTLPVSLTNGETDANNYFLDAPICALLVTNTNDNGLGSFREALECAEVGDTIRFHPVLTGLTIGINSGVLQLDQDVVVLSDLFPRLTIASQLAGLFDILPAVEAEFIGLNIVSGFPLVPAGAAFENHGTLRLQNTSVFRNPLFTSGQYLIRNHPMSELFLSGQTFLETD